MSARNLQEALVEETDQEYHHKLLPIAHGAAVAKVRAIGMLTTFGLKRYASRIIDELEPFSWEVGESKFQPVHPTLVVCRAEDEENWMVISPPQTSEKDVPRIVRKAFERLGFRSVLVKFPSSKPDEYYLRVIILEEAISPPDVPGEAIKFIAYLRFKEF